MYLRKFIVLLFGAVLCVACNKNMFDEEYYKEIVEIAQPVADIDASQTWDLTTDYYVTVTPGNALPSATRLRVLSGNPAQGQNTTVLGDYLLDGTGKQYIAFSAPALLTKFYAALIDDQGYYTIAAFTNGQRNVDFDNPVVNKMKVNGDFTPPHEFSYCFEDEMPEPGDYDYNDVVLRISQERTAENQITLHVTLAAVGSQSQVAAALRLPGYQYEDIVSVTTVGGETFDDGYTKSPLPFIESSELLMRGSNGEAVINLFEDAHWATGTGEYNSEGLLPRYKYNVAHTTTAVHRVVPERTISYVLTFKNPLMLNYFTLTTLDPFIITEYFGALMENHAVYKYRLSTVLHEYVQPSNVAILPWSLIIPTGSFHYPLDEMNIGYDRDEALFGAYMTKNHAFGEWARKSTVARDWYNYPTENMIY